MTLLFIIAKTVRLPRTLRAQVSARKRYVIRDAMQRSTSQREATTDSVRTNPSVDDFRKVNCPDERMPARMRRSRTALMRHEKFRAAMTFAC
jgi:hypothetical protein